MTDDREPFREARAAGLKARQEQRLARATYTAAEVKVLTETASKVAYALGHKDAGDEIADWADDLGAGVMYRDKPYNQGFIHASETVARHARLVASRDLASQPAGAAPDSPSDASGYSDLPQGPQAGRGESS